MIQRQKLTSKLERGTPVIVKWDINVLATLIQYGEQVSEVKFADGRIRFIPNNQLEF